MKNTIKRLGVIAMVAMIGFSMTSCDSGGGSGGGGDNAFLGTTLELSGQVYQMGWDDDDNRRLIHHTGTRAIASAGFWFADTDEGWHAVGGSGTITGGQLSFTVGTPSVAAMVDIDYFFDDAHFEEMFNNFSISNRNARIAVIESLRLTGGNDVGRFRETATSWAEVIFMYVDTEVTIRGNGRTGTWECDCWECRCENWGGACYCDETFITRSFNITLQPGWNAIRVIHEEISAGGRMTITTGNPANFRWVMDMDW